MNRNDVMNEVRSYLAENEEVSNDAIGLKLLRMAFVELERQPTSAPAEIPAYMHSLAVFAWDVCAELGILPEEGDEPVATIAAALRAEPELTDKALGLISAMRPVGNDDAARFVDAVRDLLDARRDETVDQLYGRLESKAQYLTGLEAGLVDRDRQIDGLQHELNAAKERLFAIRIKLGIPAAATGTVEMLELANIDLLIQQRQAAQDRLLVGRDEEPSEGTLEQLIDRCLTVMRMDWQDVEDLPDEIGRLKAATADNDIDAVAPDVRLTTAGWVNDCVDLAHAVAGDLSPENRVMAKAARAIIQTAPREA